MTFRFTAEQLLEIIPTDGWYEVLVEQLPKFGINTKARVAGFLAQCGHESSDFKVLIENLNYSSEALLRMFPKYFKSSAEAALYHREPSKIANRIYANRMGNGNEESGDGWTFRGRGLIQVTGKANYTAASLYIFEDLRVLSAPEQFTTNEGAVQSACWFWAKHGCNELADAEDMVALTKRINGGVIGLDDRQYRYQKAISIL